jgi:hypothetical protein
MVKRLLYFSFQFHIRAFYHDTFDALSDTTLIRDSIEFGHRIAWNCIQNLGAELSL